MKAVKKILIVFPDSHLAYSPTTLQLYITLTKKFEPQLFCFEAAEITGLSGYKINRAKRILGLGKTIKLLQLISPSLFKRNYLFYYNRIQLQLHLLFNSYQHIIYTDLLSVALAGKLYKKGTLLSLELTQNTNKYLEYLNKGFENLIIQSDLRKNIYFSNLNCDTFYIQNAPNFNINQLSTLLPKKRNQFVFAGTASINFGITNFLQLLNLKESNTLIIKGKVTPEIQNYLQVGNLLKGNKIVIQNKYETDEDYLINLSENEIGFVWYNLEGFPMEHRENYRTGPSGKMFKCFAAGVPLIGLNIPAFYPVELFGAGVLIDTFDLKLVEEAVKKIQTNYDYYHQNCFKAAQFYDFESSSEKYIFKLNKTL